MKLMKNFLQQIWNKKYYNNNRSSLFKEIIGHNEIKVLFKKNHKLGKGGSFATSGTSGFSKNLVFVGDILAFQGIDPCNWKQYYKSWMDKPVI